MIARGHDSKASAFLEKHKDNREFTELAVIVRRLRAALTM